jgi:hypothetical protein
MMFLVFWNQYLSMKLFLVSRKFSFFCVLLFVCNRLLKKLQMTTAPRLGLIPSCGLTLLKSPKDTFDYVLYITDDTVTVKVLCHKCVLLSHSERLRELISGENYFDLDIKVKKGYISSLLQLIQYMYLKDPMLISNSDKILELCGMFHMELDHFIIRTNKAVQLNTYPMTSIVLKHQQKQHDEKCLFATEFTKLIHIKDLVPVDINNLIPVDITLSKPIQNTFDKHINDQDHKITVEKNTNRYPKRKRSKKNIN